MRYNELLTTNDIIDILSNKLNFTLKSKGSSIFFNCPFHKDNNPSFSFNPTHKLLKCFSCHNFNQGKAGNIFEFWSECKGIKFQDALKEISKLGYFSLNSWQENIKKEENAKNVLWEFSSLVTEIYNYNLFTEKGKVTKEYLQKERSVSLESIKYFSLGCTINNWQLTNIFYLNNKKDYSLALQHFTSLWYINENNQVSDFFPLNSIIFPLVNEENKIISWAARQIKAEKKNNKSKYIFLPSYTGYQKTNLLYNYINSKKNLSNECYLVEGFFDVIRLTELGINNCLALLGTAVSDKQIKLLQKLKKRLVIFLDNDDAGQAATIDIAIALLLQEIDCEIVKANYEGDPDNICCNRSREEIFKILEERQNPFEFILDYHFKQLDISNNPQRVTSFIEKISSIFIKFKYNVQDFLIEKINQLVHWKKEEISNYFCSKNFITIPKKQDLLLKKNCEKEIIDNEKILLYLSLQSRKNWLQIIIKDYFFSDINNRSYYQIIYNYYDNYPEQQNFISCEIHKILDKQIKKEINYNNTNSEYINNIYQKIGHIKKFQKNYERIFTKESNNLI